MEKLKLLLLAFFLGLSINSWAQKTEVSGVILDDKNLPLPAANIIEKGTTNSVVTDFDGKFRLSVSNPNAVLLVSFLGFTDQTIKLDGSKANLTIRLASATNALDQVVVVGYGKGSRKNLTTSVTSLKADELNRGAISDVGQLLQGKVSGLNISSSGDPTKTASVVLRGVSTLNSSQGPFYVIDGVPGVDISVISPDDIATIDVLKDAAATAIYGNRAANGVIMVTTKKGSKDRTQIAYNGYVGWEEVSNQLDMMDANQLRAFTTKNNLNFTPENDKGANTNWQKEILRSERAKSSSHNLSMSGGGKNGSYTASLTSLNKEGVLLKSDFSRIIARLSVEQFAFDDKVKFGLNVTNSNSKYVNVPQRNTVLLQAASYLPVSPVRNDDGSFFENFTSTGYFNPVALIEHGTDETKTNNLVGNLTAEVKLPFGFTYNLNIAHQKLTTSHGEFYDSYYSKYNSANFYNNPDPPQTKTLINFGVNGSALRNNYENTNNIIESFLTWDKTLGDHKIKAVLGYSWQENTLGDGFQATATNFPVDNVGYNNLALSNYMSVNGYVVNFGDSRAYQKTRLIGEFARLNYNYHDKYLLQGTIRRDGGSVFGANNRWGYFPSVGAAWRVDKEGFMQDQKLFSDLKFRGSYGVTGNSSGFNAYTAQFISGSLGTFYYNGQQIGAYGPNQAANPDLKWEKTATANIGIDFGLFNGKITGSVDLYNKKTTDMIFNYAVNPVLVPVGSIVANGGSMSNKGIEVSLGATPVKTANFTWSTNLNLASNKNEIVKLTNPFFIGGDSIRRVQPDGGGQTGSTLQIFKEGKPLGQFFTLKYAGKNSAGVSQYVAKDGSLTTTPAIGVDYHYAGSAQPKVLLGWGNNFQYKKFDLSIFFRGVFGNKIFNATRADLFRPSTAMTTNILADASDESPNDLNAYRYSSRFIEDGSYIRLDNMTLGYNFGKVSKFIQSVRVYQTINNLFVITKYSGIDPEVEQGGTAPGVDSNNFYPKTRTFMFGLNVIF
ncbi:SusC/RagA family TonB-linked outer membrane protein [Flavobacterium sp. W22_SRS_FK3]|uniref:SusC/RagA family TonB-linked outer membrane protein n=1 Tax=Flavobacterium sp. W22_SRS_FK3 TaxID=3240275 RepID=UPI003F91DA82